MDRFKITWMGDGYKVSIPNYAGGEVVPAEAYDRLAREHEELKAADRMHAGVGKVREERISRLTAERDWMRNLLAWIDERCSGERVTVHEGNAFEQFGKLNRLLVEIRTRVRAALATPSTPQESAKVGE
jgi:hypothetical protein